MSGFYQSSLGIFQSIRIVILSLQYSTMSAVPLKLFENSGEPKICFFYHIGCWSVSCNTLACCAPSYEAPIILHNPVLEQGR